MLCIIILILAFAILLMSRKREGFFTSPDYMRSYKMGPVFCNDCNGNIAQPGCYGNRLDLAPY